MATNKEPALRRKTPLLICSSRTAIPYPCMGSSASVFRMSMSRVPWTRSPDLSPIDAFLLRIKWKDTPLLLIVKRRRSQASAPDSSQPGPAFSGAIRIYDARLATATLLELVPQELVVHLVVELHLGDLHHRPERTRAAIRGDALQFRVAAFDVRAKQGRGPLRLLEIFQRGVNVVRQVALGGAQILDLGDLPVQSGFEDGVHHYVRICVRSDCPHFRAHAALVANGDAHHRSAVDRRSIQLIGRFEVRVQPAIRVHAGVEEQANVVAVCEDAVHKVPAKFAELLLALGIPKQVLALLADGNVSVHATPIHSDHRLRQEA